MPLILSVKQGSCKEARILTSKSLVSPDSASKLSLQCSSRGGRSYHSAIWAVKKKQSHCLLQSGNIIPSTNHGFLSLNDRQNATYIMSDNYKILPKTLRLTFFHYEQLKSVQTKSHSTIYSFQPPNHAIYNISIKQLFTTIIKIMYQCLCNADANFYPVRMASIISPCVRRLMLNLFYQTFDICDQMESIKTTFLELVYRQQHDWARVYKSVALQTVKKKTHAKTCKTKYTILDVENN